MHLQDAFKIMCFGCSILACEVRPAADSEETITTIKESYAEKKLKYVVYCDLNNTASMSVATLSYIHGVQNQKFLRKIFSVSVLIFPQVVMHLVKYVNSAACITV